MVSHQRGKLCCVVCGGVLDDLSDRRMVVAIQSTITTHGTETWQDEGKHALTGTHPHGGQRRDLPVDPEHRPVVSCHVVCRE